MTPNRPLPATVVVVLDVYSADGYASVECQLGVHRACPGGLKGDPKTAKGGGDWICHCEEEMCPCRRTT